MNMTKIEQPKLKFEPQLELETLVDNCATDWACFLANPKAKKSKDMVTKNQIRKYFHEIKEIYNQLKPYREEEKENRFKQIKFKLKILKSRVTYDANRDSNGIPSSLRDFIINGSDQCRTYSDFEKFVLHFEAVVGFFYQYAKK